MTKAKKKLDAESILAALTELRKSIPHADLPREGSDTLVPDGADDAEAFDLLAIQAGVQLLADELRDEVDRREAWLYRKSLEVYYAAEELARDPLHADLIPRVEEMRRAYEESYGTAIPPRAR
jgi:hypothetical protein